MLLLGVIISALVLLLLLVIVFWRARRYVRLHPELITTGIPVGYVRCQRTLRRVMVRYREMVAANLGDTTITWQSPLGFRYTLSEQGIDQRRGSTHRYTLRWDEIGGVGMRMQPGFTFKDEDHDGRTDSRRTTSYGFYLLVVPNSGPTMSIQIPTNDRPAAIDFTAYMLVLAEQRRKRINVFGFNRPPSPQKQKIPKV
ncbi:MAG: hypothetical protein K8S97_08225 [Anaerolineae bacterium]|nr:hypothetical protein [Anaerolineae bacterium]